MIGDSDSTDGRLEVSIIPTWEDSTTKRAGFDVTTADGTAQLTMDMAATGLLRLGAVLPSGRSYSAEIEDELTALRSRRTTMTNSRAHLRTAIAFVIGCFKREALGEN